MYHHRDRELAWNCAQVVLTVEGHTSQPDIEVTPSLLDFGSHAAGRTVVRRFLMKNKSSSPAKYQFSHAESGSFTLDKPQGTLAASSQQEVVARFRAVEPAHYWKRLSCHVLVRSPCPWDLSLSTYLDSFRPPTYSSLVLYAKKGLASSITMLFMLCMLL